MCYDHGDGIPILREGWRRARKQHRCTECDRRRAIQPGDLYLYAVGADSGEFCSWYICESCNTLAAFLFAEERSVGCAPGESRPPLGGGMLMDDIQERGWALDDDYADDQWEDYALEGGEPPHVVVRWHHIDAARAGKRDTAFLREVARRMELPA